MSSESPSANARPGWAPPTVGIPSWIVSVAAHGVLLFVCATTLRSCAGPGMLGEEETREVGIVMKASDSTHEAEVTPVETAASQAETTSAPTTAAPAESQYVENLLDLPPDVVGIGGPAAPLAALPKQPAQSSAAPPPRSAAAGSGDQLSFLGATAQGKSVVYVLDRSASMANFNAIRVAKSELQASLNSLSSNQSFQIVFFNTYSELMTRPGTKPQLYRATDLNRNLATQFIRPITPALGTQRINALRQALEFRPDVIFLLTDAAEPPYPGDLDEIRKLNQERSQIHCIEFGIGPRLDSDEDNFLRRLARENKKGTYRYRDITQLKKPGGGP